MNICSIEITLLSTSEVTLPSALLCPSPPWLLGLAPAIALMSNLDLLFCAPPRFCALFDPFRPQTSLALPFKNWPWCSILFLSFLKYEINQNQLLFDQHVERRPYQNQKLGTASACLVLIKALTDASLKGYPELSLSKLQNQFKVLWSIHKHLNITKNPYVIMNNITKVYSQH